MKNKNSKGFTILELIVAAVIITVATGLTIPNYTNRVKQGAVDRYSRAVEAGFFSFQDDIKSYRTSCKIRFQKPDLWLTPNELLEFEPSSFGQGDDRLRCCNSQLEQQSGEDCPTIGNIQTLSNISENVKSIRFIRFQNSSDSKKVEVMASSQSRPCIITNNLGKDFVDSSSLCYTFLPLGNNVEVAPLYFIVRLLDAENNPQIKSRCIKIEGSSSVWWGTLNGPPKPDNCEFKDD
jgi:prepilin-type N-terminal cleavage/methylation domain-containing protein